LISTDGHFYGLLYKIAAILAELSEAEKSELLAAMRTLGTGD
jgi:hypothetical protein